MADNNFVDNPRAELVEALADEIEHLRAENARLLDLLTWRPIETAPKDGSMFLVRLPRMMNLIIRARYNTVHKHFVTDCEIEGAVSAPTFFHKSDFWMQLPAPPYRTKETTDDQT